jgi:hypothetical protein
MAKKSTQLKAEWCKANAAEDAARRKYESERDSRLSVARAQILADLEPLDKERARLNREAHDARVRYEAALVEEAKAGDGAPYPIGTVMCEWDLEGSSWDRKRKFVPTGKRGVVEVWTRESVVSAALGRYSWPDPGTFIIRIFKKDGKPGTAFVKLGSWRADGWHPEGKAPKAQVR